MSHGLKRRGPGVDLQAEFGFATVGCPGQLGAPDRSDRVHLARAVTACCRRLLSEPSAASAAAGQQVPLCTDAAGDGAAADLLSVASMYAQQQVFLAFSFATALPAGAATLTLESSTPQRRIRIGLRDARPVTVVMETADSTATAAHADELVHVAGAEVHVVLPAVTVPAKARGWQAVVAVGATHDVCGTPG